jgi:hypothetical protein
MQHVSVADKSLLMGDEIVDLLLEYSALLGKVGSADSIKINAISGDGDEVVVGMLLNAGTVFVSESTTSRFAVPENTEAEAYLRARIDSYGLSSVVPFGIDDDGGITGWGASG